MHLRSAAREAASVATPQLTDLSSPVINSLTWARNPCSNKSLGGSLGRALANICGDIVSVAGRGGTGVCGRKQGDATLVIASPKRRRGDARPSSGPTLISIIRTPLR